MKQTTREILEGAMRLPPVERAQLIELIIESFDVEPESDIQKMWINEAQRRLDLHKSGDGNTLTEEEVFNRIEKEIK